MADDQPASVQQALAAVMAELPAIGKDSQAAQQQGGYAYRGIEQITRHVQGLFAKHGVVVVPQVQSIDVRGLTVNNKPWSDTTLTVDYQVFGPDGSFVKATCVGIGRDNSDKGANKAMTQAFKYLLLQLLCISDAKDDTDGINHEADAPRDCPTNDQTSTVIELFNRIGVDDKAERLELTRFHAGRDVDAWGSLTRDEADRVIRELTIVADNQPQPEPDEPQPTESTDQ